MAGVMDISGSLGRRARTLSGGQRRRLEIVRALMHRPRVLFLDEPTAGLDPASRRDLWAYLRQERARAGTTVFLTTHYLEEAEAADSVCVLAGGKIIERGRPAEVKERQLQPDAGGRLPAAAGTGRSAGTGPIMSAQGGCRICAPGVRPPGDRPAPRAVRAAGHRPARRDQAAARPSPAGRQPGVSRPAHRRAGRHPAAHRGAGHRPERGDARVHRGARRQPVPVRGRGHDLDRGGPGERLLP